jgi:hypothetical protein
VAVLNPWGQIEPGIPHRFRATTDYVDTRPYDPELYTSCRDSRLVLAAVRQKQPPPATSCGRSGRFRRLIEVSARQKTNIWKWKLQISGLRNSCFTKVDRSGIFLRSPDKNGILNVAWLSRAGKPLKNARLGRARLRIMSGTLNEPSKSRRFRPVPLDRAASADPEGPFR